MVIVFHCGKLATPRTINATAVRIVIPIVGDKFPRCSPFFSKYPPTPHKMAVNNANNCGFNIFPLPIVNYF
jgi:hypothetical protein